MKLFFTLLLISGLVGSLQAQPVFKDVTAVQFGDSILINWTLIGGATCFDMSLKRAEEDVESQIIFTVGGTCGGTDDQFYSYIDNNDLVSGHTYYYSISASAGTLATDPVEIKYINAGSVKVFIYPNPSIIEMNITIDNQYTPAFLVELYSLDGKLLLQSLQFANLFSLNTEYLLSGPYILKITTEEGIYFAEKIIVQ